MNSIIGKYFPRLTPRQVEQFEALPVLYSEWNARINVISRRDIGHLEVHHVLHSLAIARAVRFKPGTRILDIGTGGGFPGIPLAILFPEASFLLADSIGKKIRVVTEIAGALGLENVVAVKARAEEMKGSFDFVTGRAVIALPDFVRIAVGKISATSIHPLRNGILYLKGGDFGDETKGLRGKVTVFSLSDWFSEDFFETKKLIHIAPAPM